MLKTVGNPSTRFGNQTIFNGNLIIGTAGQGVDFSATGGGGSGTLTSSLFDDYEEGTWPAFYTADTPPTTPWTMGNISATYTKIGRLVTVRGWIQTNNVNTAGAAGGVRIGGLPFASAANEWSVLSIGYSTNFAVGNPMYGLVREGTTEISLYKRSAADGSQSQLALTDLTSGANNGQNSLVVFGQYYAAT